MAELDKIRLHKNDLPDDVVIEGDIAIDVESMGLVIKRDRMCLIQLVGESGPVHLVQFDGKDYSAPNLKRIIADQSKEKIFHFARFDVAMIYAYLGIWAEPIYCTKIASKIARTYSKSHGLKELCNTLLSVKLNKQQQTSDWGSEGLTKEQLVYAASDVLYLHKLRSALNTLLINAERQHLAQGCFKSLHGIIELEVAGWDPMSVFNHSTNQPSPFIPQPS